MSITIYRTENPDHKIRNEGDLVGSKDIPCYLADMRVDSSP